MKIQIENLTLSTHNLVNDNYVELILNDEIENVMLSIDDLQAALDAFKSVRKYNYEHDIRCERTQKSAE